MALIETDNMAPVPAMTDDTLQVDLSTAHPRENPHFIGHKDGEEAFLKAWHSDYFHPVYLISGASGIGKATFAYRIARYILNDAGGGLLLGDDSSNGASGSLDSDFNSAISRQIIGNSHPNMMILEPGLPKLEGSGVNTSISTDWMRKLTERAHQTAADDGWRIYIIDKADDMTPNAVNAALKILEEPPARSMFLIVCDAPYRLPPPLRSRCQEIHLNPLSVKEVHDFLTLSNIDPDPLAIESLAQLSDGGIGRALNWWRIGALTIYDELILSLQASLDGTTQPSDLLTLSELIATRDSKEEKDHNIAYSFNAFSTMLGDYLAKAIFAFSTNKVPQRVRPHIDDGVIEALMATPQNVDNWLNLREILQAVARKATPPLRLEKQQTVLEILWRLRYGCQGNWTAALRKFD